MSAAAEARALLSTIDAGASGLTLCRVAAGVRLVGTAYDGVTALQVLTGTLRLSLPGGEVRVARAGQLVLVPAGIRPEMAADGPAATEVVDGGKVVSGRRDGWLTADATRGRPARLVVAAARVTGTARQTLSGVVIAPLGMLPEGRGALAMLRAELARAAPGSNTLAVTLMSLCIVVGLRIAVAGQRSAAAEIPDRRGAIDRAVAGVRARPADPHDIDTLARVAGMSRSTLLRYFRNELRTTPNAFVLKARLAEAAALLRTTALPVKAIAAAAGFADRSHFSRTFQRQYGTDPTGYRQQATDEA